jgi:phosphohistidine phosphatase SixA
VTIFLIRHAHAGARASWNGDDLARPLDGKGRRQAEHLAGILADAPIGVIYSSPSARCIETVEPLARQRGLIVHTVGVLHEGSDRDDAVRFALEHAAENPVLCTHGDLVPKMLRRFRGGGMRSTKANESAKGSVWQLEVDGNGTVVSGVYHPPLDTPTPAG